MLVEGVQSMISQIPSNSIQITGSSGRIPSMLHTSYKPHTTSQIPWFDSNWLCIPVGYTVPCLQRVYTWSSPRHPVAVSKSLEAPVGPLAYYAHPSSSITLLRYFGFIGTNSIFLLSTLSHPCRGCSINPAALFKSPEALVGFLACYTHPAILIPLLRYLGFIVTDSIFLLSTLS